MSWPLTGLVASKVIGSPVKRLVLLTMASRANDDGTGIYASFATMARDCELSRATVKRTIKELEDEGLVKQVGTRPCANGKTNDYSVSVRRISALPNIKKDRGQSEPGSDSTGVNDVNPGQSEPGSTAEPGSERTPTRVTVTPKPILEPIAVVVDAGRLEALKARADGAINLTSGHVHHFGEIGRLLRGGCVWEDLENATDAITASFKAKGKRFHSWAVISELAVELRDRRLQGVPEPQQRTEQPRRSQRESMSAAIDRVFAEEEAKREQTR